MLAGLLGPGSVLTALPPQTLIPLSLEGTEVGQAKAAQALAKITITSNPEMAFPGERVSAARRVLFWGGGAAPSSPHLGRVFAWDFPHTGGLWEGRGLAAAPPQGRQRLMLAESELLLVADLLPVRGSPCSVGCLGVLRPQPEPL